MTSNEKKNNNGYEWSYGKLAYLLDVAEVVWPMCDAIKAAGIWTVEELTAAMQDKTHKLWSDKRVSARGIKQVNAMLT